MTSTAKTTIYIVMNTSKGVSLKLRVSCAVVVFDKVLNIMVKLFLRIVFFSISCSEARGIRFRSSRCCCCMGTIPGMKIRVPRGRMGRVARRRKRSTRVPGISRARGGATISRISSLGRIRRGRRRSRSRRLGGRSSLTRAAVFGSSGVARSVLLAEDLDGRLNLSRGRRGGR